jgi:hypothetical protein
MTLSSNCRIGLGLLALVAAGLTASALRADEIRLKDGKKLYGVIVGYDDNMFKIKTDFGYVLVEKDKIAQIIPSGGGETAVAKPATHPTAKPSTATPRKVEPDAAVTSAKTDPEIAPTPVPAPPKREIAASANARPTVPAAKAVSLDATPPALKSSAPTGKTPLNGASGLAGAPKEEAPISPEEIQGNLYINHAYGFHMYKAPSWQIIEDAGQTLPNAIVAMGTSNESTLLVIGHEKTKAPLESAAPAVEKRVKDVYENYRLISQKKTLVSGQPGIEYHFRGLADGHDWSGTLVVVSRAGDIFTILGMTFADTDLIQIQENVITRSIASVDLNAK